MCFRDGAFFLKEWIEFYLGNHMSQDNSMESPNFFRFKDSKSPFLSVKKQEREKRLDELDSRIS